MSHPIRYAITIVVFAAAAAIDAHATSVGKQIIFVQTGPSTVKIDLSKSPGACRFYAFVSASANTNTAVAPSLTLPNNGRTYSLVQRLGGVTTTGWNFEQYFASQEEMSSAFPNGTYQLAFGGRPPLSIPFEGDFYSDLPLPKLSGGTFNSNGELVVDPALPLTITIALTENDRVRFSGATIAVGDGFDIARLHTSQAVVYLTAHKAASDNTAAPVSLTVPANFFVMGKSYGIACVAGRVASRIQIPGLPIGSEATATYVTSVRLYVVVGTPPREFSQKEPNKAPEPTPTAVTSPAAQEPRQP